jgi:Tfp pilus assembly protein PilO
MQDLQEQIRRVEEELASSEAGVPPTSGLGPFLEQVTNLASNEGVVDPIIEPLTPLTGPAVEVLPIQMSFEGGFGSVYDFLEALESLPRLARVSHLGLRRAPGQPSALEADVIVQIFHRHRPKDDSIGS